MMLETIDHGAVRELRLARPPANALDPGLVAGLRAALAAAPSSGARALVLSGSPGIFSGGLDVPALLALDRPAMESFVRDFFGLLADLASSSLPLAAAVTGHSPAGGAVLALFCDYRVMAEGDFRIGLNEVQVGIPLPAPIHAALVHVVGSRQAERLGVGGLMIPASEALRIGFVDELVAAPEVVPRALAWCGALLALPPSAMERTRALARGGLARAVVGLAEDALARFLDDWYGAETQAVLSALVERLREKAKTKS